MDKLIIARWESKSGKYHVTLYCDDYGYSYSAVNAGGNLGAFASDADAIAAIAPRVNDFQPDANKTPMQRVQDCEQCGRYTSRIIDGLHVCTVCVPE